MKSPFVLRTGLEPVRTQCSQDFKSCVSTNSTTRAYQCLKKNPIKSDFFGRAENETRTRDPNLGKVVLYQLSYFRLFCVCKDISFS